nr:unnamed protein product [Callosobruchus analis]
MKRLVALNKRKVSCKIKELRNRNELARHKKKLHCDCKTANCIVLHVWLVYIHTPVLVWIIA